jgi:serine/threonine-protein kinase
VLALLVAVGAIVALVTGGSDKATAPVVPRTHTKPAKPKKTPAAPQQTSSQTTPAPASTSTSTTPVPSGTDLQRGTQLQTQAHDLIGQGRYNEAIPLDQQAVEALKNTGSLEYAYALFDLGHALRLAGHPDLAIPVLEQRMQIDNQRDVVKAELKQAKAEAKGKG